MKRLLAKLPRSSSGSREASASSSASRLPLDIFEVSITAAASRFSGFALVSSAICFSGASSGDFISIVCHSESFDFAQDRLRQEPLDISQEKVRDVSTSLDMTGTQVRTVLTPHKISSHSAHVSSIFRME